jgi:hypothetical protein
MIHVLNNSIKFNIMWRSEPTLKNGAYPLSLISRETNQIYNFDV